MWNTIPKPSSIYPVEKLCHPWKIVWASYLANVILIITFFFSKFHHTPIFNFAKSVECKRVYLFIWCAVIPLTHLRIHRRDRHESMPISAWLERHSLLVLDTRHTMDVLRRLLDPLQKAHPGLFLTQGIDPASTTSSESTQALLPHLRTISSTWGHCASIFSVHTLARISRIHSHPLLDRRSLQTKNLSLPILVGMTIGGCSVTRKWKHYSSPWFSSFHHDQDTHTQANAQWQKLNHCMYVVSCTPNNLPIYIDPIATSLKVHGCPHAWFW